MELMIQHIPYITQRVELLSLFALISSLKMVDPKQINEQWLPLQLEQGAVKSQCLGS